MSTISPFTKATANGCAAQVQRAKHCSQLVSEIVQHESGLSVNVNAPALHAACGCRIAENGCLDVSLCHVTHPLHAVPFLERWCDVSTCLVQGGGHLIAWSGWARPAVLKLLGRYPRVGDVRGVLEKTHRSVSHRGMSMSYRLVEDKSDSSKRFIYWGYARRADGGEPVHRILARVDADVRFAEHDAPVETES
jgi:hypothetical protein